MSTQGIPIGAGIIKYATHQEARKANIEKSKERYWKNRDEILAKQKEYKKQQREIRKQNKQTYEYIINHPILLFEFLKHLSVTNSQLYQQWLVENKHNFIQPQIDQIVTPNFILEIQK